MLNMMVFGVILYIFSLILMVMSVLYMYTMQLIVMEWNIFEYMSMKLNMFILIDNLSLVFMMIVSLISSLIMFYSMKYMNLSELNVKRFYYLVMLFIFSMYFMIMSPSIMSIILGWDGLGLISFCLIVYYQNSKAMSAGMLTMILNRIGDASLLSMMGFMCMFGSWNLMLYNMNYYLIILIMLMVLTKSAQMPFSLWLPAAMMAPTPVSSLVHSSTLVTAGVYVMIRYGEFMTINVKMKLMLISSLTMLLSGLFANYEIDFKKIIALSTLSQLGFMMSILFMGFKDLAFLHLYIHAMFKSLMFMCAGSFIHYNNSVQDVRDYGNMLNLYPLKSLIMIFTSLSLMGFPFLLGFYSKDLIMEEFFFNKLKLLNLFNLLFGTIFTVSYSIRLIMLIMFNKMFKFNYIMICEDNLMNLVMMKLMLISFMYSKFYYMMLYSFYNVNLSMNLKFMLIKMFLIGMIIGLLNYKNYNFVMNNMSLMFKNMNYLNKFYNYIYLNILNFILKYEMIMEKKNIPLLMNELFNLLMNMMNLKFLNISIYNLMLMYMYLFMYMYMWIY